jgi:hypothetical protein
MNSPPVAFVIPTEDISSSPKSSFSVKLRLEKRLDENAAAAPPTLQQVEDKLKKAEAIRKQQFVKQHPIALKTGKLIS